MKTIHSLEEAQRVYYKGYNDRFEPIVCSMLYSDKEFAINKRLVTNLKNSNNLFLTEEDCQKSIDYDVALAKINKRASELEQEVELLEDYQYIDLHESKHRGLTIHPTHYIDCAKPEKYAREKIPYKLCFDYNVCVSLIEELPEECKIVLGVL